MRFNRFFWKIFAAMWLMNIVLIGSVMWLLNAGHLRERMQHQHSLQVERLAQALVARVGNNPSAYPALTIRSPKVKGLFRRFELPVHLPLTITNAQGAPVFHRHKRFNPRQLNRPNMQQLQVGGGDAPLYTVYYEVAKVPPLLAQALTKLASVQLLLMLMASAVVSALMSWRITQPLKALQRFSQTYVPAASEPTLAASLLTRGDELGDLARAITRMTTQIDAAFSAQKDLLHDVSHELRAPLARLQVAAALAETTPNPAIAVAKIHTECQRMDQLIQSILVFARLHESANTQAYAAAPSLAEPATKQPITKPMEVINLGLLLSQITDDIKFEFTTTPIQLKGVPSAEALVNGDSALVQSTFENLMRNACQHTPAGTAVTVELRGDNNHWVVCVRDNGPGISEPPEQCLKPFYRAGGQMHGQGFGLGLSIAQRAVTVLGGSLHLANHSQGGLEACVSLPKALIPA